MRVAVRLTDARKRLFLFIATLSALACAGASRADHAGFFAGGGEAAALLPADGIYPQGQRIGFGIYSARGQNRAVPELSNIERVADEGFTLVGPYYHLDWRRDGVGYAREAHDAGLQFTYQIRPHASLNGVSLADRPAAIAALTDAEIHASVHEQVNAILADPILDDVVARWSLHVAEVRFWIPEEVRYLEQSRLALQQAEAAAGAPHRPFWSYEPNHRQRSDLNLTGVHQDLIGKGVYLTNQYDRGDQRSGFAMWSFDQILASADDLGATPQAFFQLSEDFTDPLVAGDPEEIRRSIRHDVYLGLVRGVRGVQVWSMHEYRRNLTTHNEQFEAYGSVAEDLTGDLNLQRPLLFGERRDDLSFTVVDGDPVIDYLHADGSTHAYPSLNTLDVAIDGSRYLFLVNSSVDELTVEIDGLPSLTLLEDVFAGETRAAGGPSKQLTIEPYGVSAYRLHPLTGDFNGDGFVDAGDYTIWRDRLDNGTPLASTAFSVWADAVQPEAAALATASASGPAAQNVPEPAATLLLAASAFGGVFAGGRRPRPCRRVQFAS